MDRVTNDGPATTQPSGAQPAGLVSERPVALVTGASRGLGYLIARELGRRGYALAICARSGDGLRAAADDLRGLGTAVHAIEADAGDAAQAGDLVEQVQREYGRLDLLVANAGIIQVGPLEAMGAEEFAEIMDSTLWSAIHTTLAAMPMLRHTRGRVLVVTSVGGKLPAPHLLPYTTAKHAAVGFAEGLRIEAGKLGVSVTVGVPGLMRTGSTRNALFVGDREAERRWFTLGASLPLVSMDAQRAAAKLVRATLRGRAEVILTPLAKVGVRVHGVAPATTLRALALVDRLLPAATAGGPPEPGHATGRAEPGWFAKLTRLDRVAARRWHEHDDPTPTSSR